MTPHQENQRQESARIGPDPDSGRRIPYEAQFTLAMIQMDASRGMVEWPFPRDKSAISPKTVSDGENILPRIYKKIISRDTKQLFVARPSSEVSSLVVGFCRRRIPVSAPTL